nr:reverse transcriptase domain-containing protein [Tanacetum cinerariifolium]
MMKFETPPDSPPITVIDPDDQPMWLSTRTVAPTPSSAIIQRPSSTNFRIKDGPTQGILDARGIFLYNTPNEAFQILEDKVLLKLDFSELKSFGGVGTGRMTKKDGMGMPQEPHKGWKLNENVVPYNENVYHYLWHPTEIPHPNRIIKES